MTQTWTIHTMEQYHPSCASRPIKHKPVHVLCNDNIVHWTLYEHKTVLVAIAHHNTTTTTFSYYHHYTVSDIPITIYLRVMTSMVKKHLSVTSIFTSIDTFYRLGL